MYLQKQKTRVSTRFKSYIVVEDIIVFENYSMTIDSCLSVLFNKQLISHIEKKAIRKKIPSLILEYLKQHEQILNNL